MTFFTPQKMEFSIKDFFSKRGQIRSFLQIWPYLLKKSLMENFAFCAVFGEVFHFAASRFTFLHTAEEFVLWMSFL